jgi:hypothetical protein
MKLRVLHHDHCFDGFASAAVFSRFFIEKIRPDAEIGYAGLAHKPNQLLIEEDLFEGEENAIILQVQPLVPADLVVRPPQAPFSRPPMEVSIPTVSTKFYIELQSCTNSSPTLPPQSRLRPEQACKFYWADASMAHPVQDARTGVDSMSRKHAMLVIEASRDRIDGKNNPDDAD